MAVTPDTLAYAIFGYVIIFGILIGYILRLAALSRQINRQHNDKD